VSRPGIDSDHGLGALHERCKSRYREIIGSILSLRAADMSQNLVVQSRLARHAEQQNGVIRVEFSESIDYRRPTIFGPVLGIARTTAITAAHGALVAGLNEQQRPILKLACCQPLVDIASGGIVHGQCRTAEWIGDRLCPTERFRQSGGDTIEALDNVLVT
jgi:hypothetical protein